MDSLIFFMAVAMIFWGILELFGGAGALIVMVIGILLYLIWWSFKIKFNDRLEIEERNNGQA